MDQTNESAKMEYQVSRFCALILGIAALVACSDGGGGNGSGLIIAPVPQPMSTFVWTPDVFEPASTFKDQCASPRTGVDIEGNAFADEQGELLHELYWLRSWTHETYLWNDEVIDRNPAGYSAATDYFDVLKTTETTQSGAPKDNFHFHQLTEDYLEQITSAARSGYGLRLAARSNTPPRDYRVVYTEPNSPASAPINGQPAFQRGDRLLEIDGVDMILANSDAEIAALNDGLFPANSGETHTFRVRQPDGVERVFSVTSADVVSAPVNQSRVISTPTGDVGYILFNTFGPFSSEEAIATAMEDMANANVDDLILDLRYNSGGLVAVASQLAYMVAGDARTDGKIFERFRFNADAGSRDPVTGSANTPFPFYSSGVGFSYPTGVPLPALDLTRVFILTTEDTCSASESVINGLRGVDVEVILIGDTTCGKPYGFYPQDNCGTTFYTIQFQGVNDKGFGDFAEGFTPANSNNNAGVRAPGCFVEDDLETALGDTAEELLSTALYYRDNGVCPLQPTIQIANNGAFKRRDGASVEDAEPVGFETVYYGAPGRVATTSLTRAQDEQRRSRDLTMPY